MHRNDAHEASQHDAARTPSDAHDSLPTPLILDCDPGHDDALAIVLALARPELELLGVTTVAGNSTLGNTTRNALSVLTLLGRTDVPVAAGASRPLARPLETAPHVHGASGLEGAALPAPAFAPAAESAVELMARLVRDSDRPMTLVATGPLTNVAKLMRGHPELYDRLARVCLMGGSLGEGNITPAAEFNFWVDPEAAAIVLAGSRPTVMMGLDVTHQALLTEADMARMEDLGTPPARVFADLLRFFARFHAERYGWDGAPIHDAVAVAHLLGRDLVSTTPFRVDVQPAGEQRGRTVATRAAEGDPRAVEVGLTIDRPAFVELLLAAMAAFP